MKSIKTKILLVVCLLLVVSIGLVGGVGAWLTYDNTKSTLKQTLSQSAEVAQLLITSSLDKYKAIATETGLVARLSNADYSIEQKQQVINDKLNQYSEFLLGNITDENGNGLLSKVNVSDRDYFTKAMSGEAYISDIVQSKSLDGKYVLTASAPLWDKGVYGSKIVGIVYYLLDANILSEITSTIKVGEKGNAYMLDKESYTIAHPTIKIEDKDNTQEKVSNNSQLKELAGLEVEMVAGKTGAGIYKYNGMNKILAFSPVENGLGWSIAVNANLGEFMGNTNTSIIITIVLTFLFILIGLIISFKLAVSISKPINNIKEAMVAMANGNFDKAVITYKSKDELGVLAENIRKSIKKITFIINDLSRGLTNISKGDFTMRSEDESAFTGSYAPLATATYKIISDLSDTLRQISITSDQVASGSEQVSNGAQALSQGATEQAGSIEELSATIMEISKQINQNADDAIHAKEVSEKGSMEIIQSNQEMIQMVEAMNDISNKSNEIGKIIKTIEDIAFQTNILALNAAVEATRAGAAGKGFAVVADEVRNLAGKSSEAAKTTETLIKDTVKAVENGAAMARKSAQSMLSVVNDSKEISEMVERISAASTAQASAVIQVTQGINQISSVVQENSATSEESAAASEELSGQAQILKELVGKFKLREKEKTVNSIQHTEKKKDILSEKSKSEKCTAKY